MKPHTIELKAFQDWRYDKLVEFAHSTQEKKRICCNVHGTIIVFHGEEVVYQGMQPYPAVEAYNNITEPPIDKQ
jgi:hypothetical protein